MTTSLSDLASAVDRLYGKVEGHEAARVRATQEVAALESEIHVLGLTGAAIGTLLAAVSKESLGTIEALVSYGLRSVFEDQQIGFRFEVRTVRGVQSVEPKLMCGGVEGNPLEAFGGGPGSLTAFLLRLIAVQRLGLAPVILLDESFSMVSEQYVGNVGKLLRELSERLGFTFLLVTHQAELLAHAHRGYEAVESSNGLTFKAI